MSVFNNLLGGKLKRALGFFLIEIVAIIAIMVLILLFAGRGIGVFDTAMVVTLVLSIFATFAFALVAFVFSEQKWTKNKYQMIPISGTKFAWLNQITSLIQVIFFGLLQVVLNSYAIIKALRDYGADLSSSLPINQATRMAGSGYATMQKFFHAFTVSGNTVSINWFNLVGGLALLLICGFFLNYATWTLIDLCAVMMENVASFKGTRIVFFAVFYIAFSLIVSQISRLLSYAFPAGSSANGLLSLNYGAVVYSLMFVAFGLVVNWLNCWIFSKYISTTK